MDPMPCHLHILDADGRLSAWLGHAIMQAWLQGHGQTAAAAWHAPAHQFITEVP